MTSKISKIEYKYPFMIDVLNPVKSIQCIKKSGKTLNNLLKDVKKQEEQLEQMQKINSARLGGRRNAITKKEDDNIKKTVKELQTVEKLLNLGLKQHIVVMKKLEKDLNSQSLYKINEKFFPSNYSI